MLILVSPFIGTYTSLLYQKKMLKKSIKRSMIAALDKDELVLLKLSQKEADTKLYWEHAKEFEYQREMYDVVDSKTFGDSVYYWCWWDHEETALNQQLSKLLAGVFGTNQQQKEKQEQLISFFKSLYWTKAYQWIALDQQNIAFHFHLRNESFDSLSSPPPSPPPQKA